MRRYIHILLLICAMPTVCFAQTDTLETILSDYFKHYNAPNYQPTGVCKLTEYNIDEEYKTISINTNDVFGAQPFTDNIVKSIYASISNALPENYRNYKLMLSSEGRNIETLIPNPYRAKHDKTRMFNGKAYNGEPWVFNASKPYTFSTGLQNHHLAICSSHGRYYKNSENTWRWQRPYLFSTAEDLLTQTFVVPFLIPMLENAGAIVYSPRDRSWQRNEIIVDNDSPTANGTYMEKQAKNPWQQAQTPGWSCTKSVIYDNENPFEMGTARIAQSISNKSKASQIKWTPNIKNAGYYPVYISYASEAEAIDDACYSVHHAGIVTEFKVNQRMGGGTWVYLGTFYFEKGETDRNCIVLSNYSVKKGTVTADAVRFGGGMGNVSRGENMETGEPQISRLPRYLEGARYSAQWNGMPNSVYSSYSGTDDYKDDINARSYAVNYLAGGSVFLPNADGRKVPFELSLAVHSDAGYKSHGIVGTMGIATTNGLAGETIYQSGISRKASYDFASLITDGIATELSRIYRTQWARREVHDKNYSESNRPAIPSAILEMLSHQNFHDMVYAHDPWFKFNLARSAYKAILRFISFEHGKKFTVSPLAPDNFRIEFTGTNDVTLKWSAVKDSLESSADPTGFIVYTRMGNGDFDNGEFVRKNSFTKKLTPGIVYSFRVTAVNKGGESFASETLAACRANTSSRPLLIVNCFDRLSGPAVVENNDSVGFDIYKDIGVAYVQTPEYSGEQKYFDLNRGGDDSETGLGKSGYELANTMIAGNTFDYVCEHGSAFSSRYSFVSCSRKSVENGSVNLAKYPMVDLVFGLQKSSRYDFKNFKTFNSALRSKISTYLANGGALLSSGAYLGSDMKSTAERTFLNQQLHCAFSGELRSNTSINGAEENFSVEQELGKETYAVQAMDCLRPVNGAQAAFKYSDGTSAGVLFQGTQYRCATLGFPLESIKDKATQKRVMLRLAKFLISEK